jgi:hypothetical protein
MIIPKELMPQLKLLKKRFGLTYQEVNNCMQGIASAALQQPLMHTSGAQGFNHYEQ